MPKKTKRLDYNKFKNKIKSKQKQNKRKRLKTKQKYNRLNHSKRNGIKSLRNKSERSIRKRIRHRRLTKKISQLQRGGSGLPVLPNKLAQCPNMTLVWGEIFLLGTLNQGISSGMASLGAHFSLKFSL